MEDNDDESIRDGNYLDAEEYGDDDNGIEVMDATHILQHKSIDVNTSVNNENEILDGYILKEES